MEQPPRRPAAPQSRPANPTPTPAHHPAPKKSRNQLLGWGALVIAIFVITGLIFFATALFSKAQSGSQIDVKKSQFQAVFLNNNQVYFGRITNITDQGITLKDVYYLQVQQNAQGSTDAKAQAQQQNLSLAKLGGELHGPEDQMFINRDQVLFWENLKDDGKVVQAIKANQK